MMTLMCVCVCVWYMCMHGPCMLWELRDECGMLVHVHGVVCACAVCVCVYVCVCMCVHVLCVR